MRKCCLFVLLMSVVALVNASEIDAIWVGILKGEHRAAANAVRDVYRHPRQTLNFFEVTPTDVVVEIWPGGGWYTEILAPLLHEKGRLYAAHFSADSSPYFQGSLTRYRQKLSTNKQLYDRVILTTLQPPKHLTIAPAASVDKVLTFRNVHNWVKAGTEKQVFDAMYDVLKPGGVLGIVEHRAKPGVSLDQMVSSGYMTEEKVKMLAVAAGFQFIKSSSINANPKDTANHPKGVWTLAPSLRLGDKDRAKYIAIGESDRMTLKFIKPVSEL